jgi:hypothetical protein
MMTVEKHVEVVFDTLIDFMQAFIHTAAAEPVYISIFGGMRARDGRTPGQVHPDYCVFIASKVNGVQTDSMIASLETKHQFAAEGISLVGKRAQQCDASTRDSGITRPRGAFAGYASKSIIPCHAHETVADSQMCANSVKLGLLIHFIASFDRYA